MCKTHKKVPVFLDAEKNYDRNYRVIADLSSFAQAMEVYIM